VPFATVTVYVGYGIRYGKATMVPRKRDTAVSALTFGDRIFCLKDAFDGTLFSGAGGFVVDWGPGLAGADVPSWGPGLVGADVPGWGPGLAGADVSHSGTKGRFSRTAPRACESGISRTRRIGAARTVLKMERISRI
jgi:hypothetical protein